MKEYKLSDIAEVQTGPFGSQLHNEDYVTVGTPIVTVEHLGNRRFSKQNLPLVSDNDKKRLTKYFLQVGDIVFSRVGSVDRCSYVTSDENGWLFSGRCLRVRCYNNCYPLFLYYYFCNESIKQYIKSIAVGATMPSINTKLMADIPVLLPNINQQKCIADILSSLDDKIEQNRRINENLEQQAQALFKSWFVDFEPFKDGKFVDSEFGKVPEGWKVVHADEVFDINIGKTPPRKESIWFSNSENSNIKWVSISDMGNCGTFIGNSREYLTQDAIKKFNIIIVPKDTILLSFKLTIGRVAIAKKMLTTNEAIARFYLPYSQYREFTYLTLKNYDYSKLGSTSSIATAVNSKIIKGMKILLPTNERIKNFSTIVKPIFDLMESYSNEIDSLSELRDTLLPRLMSGELKITDIVDMNLSDYKYY